MVAALCRFMILMASRPRSGSLRTTWVTPATIVLCMVAVVGGVLLEVLILRVGVDGRSVPALIGAAVVAVLVVSSACVAVIEIAQRR